MGRRGYPLEVRRRALDRIEAGRKVVDVARDLGVSEQTLSTWRLQDRIDRGLASGMTSLENAALAAVDKRIQQLETELAVTRRAVELLKEPTDPKGGSRPSL
jgi:transposase-like protein